MPKNKSKGTKKTGRVTMTLSNDMLTSLDKEIHRIQSHAPDVNPTRSSVARGLLKSCLSKSSDSVGDRKEAHNVILKRAAIMKTDGKKFLNEGKTRESQSSFLLAASMELEALSVLGTEDEVAVKSTIIETLMLLKLATGYRKLPEVPQQQEFIKYQDS